MKQLTVSALLISFLTFFSINSFACSAMGPNTHVGNITAVDNDAKTFTIQDVETNKPITFHMNEKVMLSLTGASGQIVVRYSGEEKGNLIATSIE
ncbi:MAG: hypothetical protein ACE5EH_02435 [Gammaproteobacteria bacterium]